MIISSTFALSATAASAILSPSLDIGDGPVLGNFVRV